MSINDGNISVEIINEVTIVVNFQGYINTGVTSHNELGDIQGGIDGERFHLSQEELDNLNNQSGSNTGDQDLSNLVPKSTTVNGHALSGNISVTTEDLGLENVDNTSDLSKPISTLTQSALDSKQNSLGFTPENSANKNINNGYAGLDGSGLIPSSLLPGFVDDVLEYANLAAFPVSGETGKMYIAIDTSKTYRWSGSVYVEISASPGSTDSITEGSVNLYFTPAKVLATLLTGLNTATNAVITASDSVLNAIGKLQRQITDLGTANTGDETTATIKTKLAITTLSGINTGDQTTVSGNAGTATALATARNIDGQSFNGTLDITVIAPGTHAATGKTTPADADELPIVDSAASNVLKKLTWANLKATLKTYFDTLYQAAFSTQSANVVYSGPATGSAATPTFRSLVLADLPEDLTGVKYQTGLYYQSPWLLGNGANTLISTGTIFAFPFMFEEDVTMSQFLARVSTGVALSNIRLFIWNDNNGVPDTVFFDPQVAVSSATTNSDAGYTGQSIVFKKRVKYWAGVSTDGVSVGLLFHGIAATLPILGSGSMAAGYGRVQKSWVWSASAGVGSFGTPTYSNSGAPTLKFVK